MAGFQVPVIPFVDINGKIGAVPFVQTEDAIPKTGIIVFTLTVKVCFVAHMPVLGVKV